MARRLGNFSKSSFRFLREASLYAYAGLALLGAFYIAFLAFTYKGEITELSPDIRSELIADSNINEAGKVPSRAREENQITQPESGFTGTASAVIPVGNTKSEDPNPVKAAKPDKVEKTQPAIAKAAAQEAVKAKTPVKPPSDTSTATKQTATVTEKPVEVVSESPRKFQVVLKSFNNPEFATEWVNKYKEAGVETKVIKAVYDNKTWYRVSHGNFASRTQALAKKAQIPVLGEKDYWISSSK